MKNLLLLLTASAILLAGCCSLPWGPDAFALVPSDATTVTILKPDAILLDSDLSQFYAAANNGEDLNGELSRVLEGTGIDPRTVSKMVFFTVEDGGVSSAYMFQDPPRIELAEPALRSGSSWASSEYSGYSIYQSGDRSIAFVGGNVVAGDLPAVKAAIDVKNGVRQDVKQNGKIMAMLSGLEQDSPVLAASELTPAVRAKISSSQGPLDAASASLVDSAGLQIRKNSANISMRMVLSEASAEDAARVKSALYGASTLLSAMADNGGALKSFLNKLQVSESGNAISISVETTADEVRAVKAELASVGA